jgi:hypothetical protein
LPAHLPGQADAPRLAGNSDQVYLIIRSDDAGMSHSVNMALQRLIETGLPVSISVMFPTPWYQETVEILKRYPAVSVGIHLTLNSEWKNYRWGPVFGSTAVPTVVDAEGVQAVVAPSTEPGVVEVFILCAGRLIAHRGFEPGDAIGLGRFAEEVLARPQENGSGPEKEGAGEARIVAAYLRRRQ